MKNGTDKRILQHQHKKKSNGNGKCKLWRRLRKRFRRIGKEDCNQ